jgi:hypothetical protein
MINALLLLLVLACVAAGTYLLVDYLYPRDAGKGEGKGSAPPLAGGGSGDRGAEGGGEEGGGGGVPEPLTEAEILGMVVLGGFVLIVSLSVISALVAVPVFVWGMRNEAAKDDRLENLKGYIRNGLREQNIPKFDQEFEDDVDPVSLLSRGISGSTSLAEHIEKVYHGREKELRKFATEKEIEDGKKRFNQSIVGVK